MLALLLRRWPLLLLLLVLAAGPAQATHLLGGEMTYRYLDANGPAAAPVRYEITVTIYNNSNPGAAQPNTNAVVGIYNPTTGAKFQLLQGVNVLAGSGASVAGGEMNITIYTISPVLQPKVPAGCAVSGPAQPFRLQKFVGVVNLPATLDGYYAVFTRSARNVDVTNLNTAGNNQPLTLYTTLAPALRPNHSPVFSDTAVAIVCQNDTTISLNNAVDADGDRLVYSFGSPYGTFPSSGANLPATFPPLPNAIAHYPGYSVAAPFGTGAGNFAILNASTGIARYGATTQGKYVVAVDVSEYRTINGREVLIGTTRRDLQLIVALCPSTKAPVLPSAVVTPRSYTIEAGQALSIPIAATQADGHPLVLTLNSALLDGPGGFAATFNNNPGSVAAGGLTGTASVSGTGTVTGTFVYNSACADARPTPYDIALTVKDTGCGGKTVADVIRVTVTKPSGPTAIAGDALVCALNTISTYTASGGTAPGISWRVVGGTFVNGRTSNPVQVKWTTAGTGLLVARGVSSYGCLTDSVSQAVSVAPAGALVVAGALSVCQGGSTTLAITGGTGPFVLTGGGTTQTGPGPFLVTPSQTTTYTITSTTTTGGCAGMGQATVTVLPLPGASVGPAARATCSGVPIALGAAAVAGSTYSWSPATGLSSPTVANPTLTLTNTTSAATTQTYTLTETNTTSGCVASHTVAVTVNPAATAVAGLAQAVCAQSTIALGAAALPGYSYQWLPATNLSSGTVAQPVLTGVNPTSAPIVQKYVVLATSALGCSAKDSVLITINPRPVADSIAGPQSVCPTITGITYTIKNPHSIAYQWAVAGGTITSGQGGLTITVNWGAAGTGTVNATAISSKDCAAIPFQLPVRINQVLQTARPTGPTSVCQADGPYPYQTAQTNGSSYSWQLFGTARGTLANTLNTTSITFTQAGLAKLVVTETSNPAGGICRGVSDTLYITVKPSPAANLAIQGPARFCVNSGAQTYSLPGAAGSTYVFQLNGTTIANVNGTVSIPASTVVGTYTLTARETNASGCAGMLYTKTFVVDPRPGALTISGPRFVCPSTPSLTYTVANPNPSSTYHWAVTGGALTAGQGTATITVGFTAGTATSVTVSVVETSQYGCAGTPVVITVVPDNAQTPQLTLASVVPTDNTKVTLTFSVANASATPNPVRVLRRDAGSTAAFVQVGTVAATATTYVDATANAAQTAYEYTLALTNGCGDVFTAPTSATTVLLKAVALPGPGGRNQGSTHLSWTAYQGFTVVGYRVYQQNDNAGYNLISTLPASALQTDVSNTIGVSGTGFNQCFRVVAFGPLLQQPPYGSNSNTSCVDFANKTAFYNIITPNGDGQNDLLIIDNVTLYPGNSITVFNRWGREVYATTNYNNTTNAWGSDPSIAAGIYYYLFKLADGTSTKGWVEVVK
jgi:gliding motility-associated-like protein